MWEKNPLVNWIGLPTRCMPIILTPLYLFFLSSLLEVSLFFLPSGLNKTGALTYKSQVGRLVFKNLSNRGAEGQPKEGAQAGDPA